MDHAGDLKPLLPELDQIRVGVIGLGYVGLPLAVEFAKHFDTTGFDLKRNRIERLREGFDETREITSQELAVASRLSLTDEPGGLRGCDVFIVTVPTPIDTFRRPDLGPLLRASRTVGEVIQPGGIVVFESTVYPGATEDDCIPVIAEVSGLTYNRDFFAGYSPERINPGDRNHRISDIVKVTSGSTPLVADFVDAMYGRVISAGTHRASSIRVAEAAKVIENTQRDVNIALINELAILFDRLGLDSEEVLAAAGTKWNFLPFRPGLVGGHCIGVDPYYLTHKAQAVGHHPEMILAGRRTNDGMGAYIASRVIQLMLQHRVQVADSRILVLGLTFKENCPDLRNTRVIDIIHELERHNAKVTIHDPNVDAGEAMQEYGIEITPSEGIEPESHDAAVLAVAHDQFRLMGGEAVRKWLRPGGVLFDVKYLFDRTEVDGWL